MKSVWIFITEIEENKVILNLEFVKNNMCILIQISQDQNMCSKN